MKDTGDFGNPLFEAITLLSVIKIVKKKNPLPLTVHGHTGLLARKL